MSNSQGTGTKVYQFALAASIGLVFIIGVGLCWRSRVLERRARAHLLLFPPPAEKVQEKPRLYDAYLELDDDGGSWHDIMPLSMSQYGVGPQPLKPVSVDVAPDPLISALSSIALIITMPSPEPFHHPTAPLHDSDLSELEEGHGPPYVELGVMDVEVHGEYINTERALCLVSSASYISSGMLARESGYVT
ncbi:hypothetical protein C8R46DRAFT_1196669 [Mycena filopes]|nr:hypothetical protein C8R46DRAFT_1196669 [Mycena filopes]